jgi:hypothetical protein
MKNKHENKMMKSGSAENKSKGSGNKFIELKLNAALRGHDAGSVIRIRVDKEGIPLDFYWRERIKDSSIDNCVSVVGNETTGKKKK